MSSSWKDHERVVAAYFGTTRGKRGADFSQKGVEVVASYAKWGKAAEIHPGLLHGEDFHTALPDYDKTGVLVECKQGYGHKLPEYFRDIHKRNPDPRDRITIALWGPYLLSWMEDTQKRAESRVFDIVWQDLMVGKELRAWNFLEQYYVEWIGRKVPKYLDDFYAQSDDYQEIYPGFLPLLALHGTRMKGRVIVTRWL